MKKFSIIVVVIILVMLFFLPIIPSQSVFMTKLQREKMNEFCVQHGCGLLILISPYEYIKTSVYNAIVQE